MAYIVTVGYVTVETAVGAGRARIDVPRGAQLPADVPAAEVEQALRLHQVAEVPDFDEPPAPDDPPADEVPDAAIPVVMAWVDGDPDRAFRALSFEQGKGDRARSTLVGDLTALIQQP